MINLSRILFVASILFMSACSTHKFGLDKNESYMFKGKNFTYAIYNEESQLINYPLFDLSNEIKRRGDENPITDVYIVSHGWNFTANEARVNYHNYIELIDKSQPKNPEFQPYIIFVSWVSTTRPLGSFTSAVLPFGLDAAVKPITSIIDQGPMHIMTAWKESMNATDIAIGTSYPNNYLDSDWLTTDYHVGLAYHSDAKLGRDLPLSTLIYELIHDDSRIDLPVNSKIHLVGHSYGAKLVALAGEEALRRWVITGLYDLGEIDKQENTNGNDEYSNCKESHEKHSAKECFENEKCKRKHKNHTKMLCTAKALGLSGTLYGYFNEAQHRVLDNIVGKIMTSTSRNKFPIESMVLFNPAMHSSEFSYPIYVTVF